jgi:hypothetical protein
MIFSKTEAVKSFHTAWNAGTHTLRRHDVEGVGQLRKQLAER